jgi:hypothetical protein
VQADRLYHVGPHGPEEGAKFYSKCSMRTLEAFKQGNNIITFVSLK